MHGIGRAVLGIPVLTAGAFVAKDGAHGVLVLAAGAGRDKDAEAQQAALDYVNYHLDAYFIGDSVIEECTTQQLDNVASYIACTKDELSTIILTAELGFGLFAATFALPLLNRALGYISLAGNAQRGTLVHNFLGRKKDEPDPNEYDPRYDPESPEFEPDEDMDDEPESAGDKIIMPNMVPLSAFESDHSFSIKNGVSPSAEITLQPGEVVYAETGSLLSMDAGIDMIVTRMGGVSSFASGESPVKLEFKNTSDQPRNLVLTPKTKGEIVEIDMSQEMRILCDNGSYFASLNAVEVGFKKYGDKSVRTFSGLGWGLQEIVEMEGPARVLLASKGQVYTKELGYNEVATVQGDAVLAMSQTVQISLKEVKGTANRIFSGEEKFLLNVHGPGKIWLATGNGEEPEKGASGIFSTIRGFLPG